jgi:prevent-host-death family protein
VLSLGDVKSHLSELVGRVHDHHERVTVTVHGRPSAILIAPEDLEALEETLEIMRDAATMNRLAESPRVADDVAWVEDPGAFISYDAESFLDEFFPGAETEVEIGAAALIARNRARTLAQARQRLGLTRAQVAGRMNVRPERVSAIERAEPGATEVRTLAAYVKALGGRLEIAAGWRSLPTSAASASC